MKLKGTIITIIIVLIGILFIQNTDIVVFKFLFWELQMSRIILFSLLLAVGSNYWFFSKFNHE